MLVSRWTPFSISTTVSSAIIVMAPAIMIPVFIEKIVSVSSVMMVRQITVTLFTAVMSIHHVRIRIQSDFSLWWWCILAPLGAWRLVKSMIMWLNWWGKSWLIQMWRTKFPSIWHLSQNIVHLSEEEKKKMLSTNISRYQRQQISSQCLNTIMEKQNHSCLSEF